MRGFALLLCCTASFAAEFRLGAGLTDYQVLQRNARNAADVTVGGSADGLTGKSIEARVVMRGKPLKGWNWRHIATIGGATWTGSISSIPIGGPYDIEFRSSGATPVVIKNILVGDLWILVVPAGVGEVVDLVDTSRIHSFDMLGRWLMSKATPGLSFAVEIAKRTQTPVGLVLCLYNDDGRAVYGAAIRRVEAAGGKIAGVLLYRGESDPEQLMTSLRRDLGKPDLEFHYLRDPFGMGDKGRMLE